MRVSTNVSLGVLLMGVFLFSLGFFILLFYFAVYSPSQFGDGSYNVGRMHNRLVGVIVGIGLQIVGAVVVMVERKQE